MSDTDFVQITATTDATGQALLYALTRRFVRLAHHLAFGGAIALRVATGGSQP